VVSDAHDAAEHIVGVALVSVVRFVQRLARPPDDLIERPQHESTFQLNFIGIVDVKLFGLAIDINGRLP